MVLCDRNSVTNGTLSQINCGEFLQHFDTYYFRRQQNKHYLHIYICLKVSGTLQVQPFLEIYGKSGKESCQNKFISVNLKISKTNFLIFYIFHFLCIQLINNKHFYIDILTTTSQNVVLCFCPIQQRHTTLASSSSFFFNTSVIIFCGFVMHTKTPHLA